MAFLDGVSKILENTKNREEKKVRQSSGSGTMLEASLSISISEIITTIRALIAHVYKYRWYWGKLIVRGESGIYCGLWIKGVSMVLECLDHAG